MTLTIVLLKYNKLKKIKIIKKNIYNKIKKYNKLKYKELFTFSL
jgi:hypothetical protein